MKYILLSIYIFLLPFSFIYAQEEEIMDNEEVVEENIQDEVETTSQEEPILPPIELSPIEILFAIAAPLIFISIGYILIKKFKL